MPRQLEGAWTVRSKPDPVDVHVGGRLRDRRTLLGLSQGEIGARLGLSFQQIQKYERGTSRIGASRLYRLSKVLGVPVDFFFEDMPMEKLALLVGHRDPSITFKRYIHLQPKDLQNTAEKFDEYAAQDGKPGLSVVS